MRVFAFGPQASYKTQGKALSGGHTPIGGTQHSFASHAELTSNHERAPLVRTHFKILPPKFFLRLLPVSALGWCFGLFL